MRLAPPYTNLIRNQLVDLIENTFRRKEALYLACNEERAFFASGEHKKYMYDLWSCQKVTDALIIFWTISILDLALSFIDKM